MASYYQRPLTSDEIYHHGILGQKWGIRRYQNADGTLTSAGKKHYYDVDKNGIPRLNNNGLRYNRQQSQKLNDYKNSTIYNLKRVNKDYNKEIEKFNSLHQKNKEHYKESFDKWSRQEGKYKNLDYYQFKEEAYRDWMSTKYGKQEAKTLKQIKQYVDDAAKQAPLYNKTYKQLFDTHSDDIKTVKYGEQVVQSIMGQIRLDAYNKT